MDGCKLVARRRSFRAADIRVPGACRSHLSPVRQKFSTTTIIVIMMATEDPFSSIPVHRSTIRALQGVKTAEQTWDDFLIALADDYISPSLRRALDRRLATEDVVPGASMKREFVDWRRRRGKLKSRE